jgi:hypothetical protein
MHEINLYDRRHSILADSHLPINRQTARKILSSKEFKSAQTPCPRSLPEKFMNYPG